MVKTKRFASAIDAKRFYRAMIHKYNTKLNGISYGYDSAIKGYIVTWRFTS